MPVKKTTRGKFTKSQRLRILVPTLVELFRAYHNVNETTGTLMKALLPASGSGEAKDSQNQLARSHRSRGERNISFGYEQRALTRIDLETAAWSPASSGPESPKDRLSPDYIYGDATCDAYFEKKK